jgi:hypothetical protein
MDARSSSSLAARGGVVGMTVAAGSGPGVVCPVFLFFLLFFSSFFSSASLERRREKEVKGKVSQEVKIFVQEHSRGVSLHPSSLARRGRGWRWGRGGFASRLLAMGGPSLRLPAGAFVIELGAALRLQAGLAPLLLQVSQGGRIDVSLGELVRQRGAIVRGVREHHSALGTPPADQPLAGLRVIIVKISRGHGPRSPCCRVLL